MSGLPEEAKELSKHIISSKYILKSDVGDVFKNNIKKWNDLFSSDLTEFNNQYEKLKNYYDKLTAIVQETHNSGNIWADGMISCNKNFIVQASSLLQTQDAIDSIFITIVKENGFIADLNSFFSTRKVSKEKIYIDMILFFTFSDDLIILESLPQNGGDSRKYLTDYIANKKNIINIIKIGKNLGINYIEDTNNEYNIEKWKNGTYNGMYENMMKIIESIANNNVIQKQIFKNPSGWQYGHFISQSAGGLKDLFGALNRIHENSVTINKYDDGFSQITYDYNININLEVLLDNLLKSDIVLVSTISHAMDRLHLYSVLLSKYVGRKNIITLSDKSQIDIFDFYDKLIRSITKKFNNDYVIFCEQFYVRLRMINELLSLYNVIPEVAKKELIIKFMLSERYIYNNSINGYVQPDTTKYFQITDDACKYIYTDVTDLIDKNSLLGQAQNITNNNIGYYLEKNDTNKSCYVDNVSINPMILNDVKSFKCYLQLNHWNKTIKILFKYTDQIPQNILNSVHIQIHKYLNNNSKELYTILSQHGGANSNELYFKKYMKYKSKIMNINNQI